MKDDKQLALSEIQVFIDMVAVWTKELSLGVISKDRYDEALKRWRTDYLKAGYSPAQLTKIIFNGKKKAHII